MASGCPSRQPYTLGLDLPKALGELLDCSAWHLSHESSCILGREPQTLARELAAMTRCHRARASADASSFKNNKRDCTETEAT